MPNAIGSVADRAPPIEARSVRHGKPVCRLAKPRNRLHRDAASGATRTLTHEAQTDMTELGLAPAQTALTRAKIEIYFFEI